MTALTYRIARETDAGELARLSDELGYPVDPDLLRERIIRLTQHPDHIVLVAELISSDAIAGWIHAAEHDILESGRTCEILGLVVDSNRRAQGIGRKLVERVEEWARQRSLNRLSVRSNVLRPEAHPFYEKLGFIRVRTQHAYRRMIDPEANNR